MSTLRHYLNVLWRRKWPILAVVLALPLVTFIASERESPLYKASADVLVNRQEVATTTLVGQTPALDDAFRTMQTQARLARVPLVGERALEAAGESTSSGYDLLDHSSVVSLGDLLTFEVSDADPDRAARLATAYAGEFVRYRRELDTVGYARTLRELRDQMNALGRVGKATSALYLRLADRELQLESLKALRSSNVSVARPALPSDAVQVAPRPRRDTAVALVVAVVVALVLVFLWESLSTRPRDRAEFEAVLGMPLLADLRSRVRAGASVDVPTASEHDALHRLRMSLELGDRALPIRRIMFTSLRSGEGRSEVVAQLALAALRAGRRVALVDLDLRESALTAMFSDRDRPGAASVARGECTVDAAVVQVPLDARALGERVAEWDSGARLEVIGCGMFVGHPAEVLSSDALASALAELADRADLVLVDVPPVLEAPDAAVVSPYVDGLVLVVGAEHARGPVLADTRRTIASWPVARLGFVLTNERVAKRWSVWRRDESEQRARSEATHVERVT